MAGNIYFVSLQHQKQIAMTEQIDNRLDQLAAELDAIDERLNALEARIKAAIQQKRERESRYAALFEGLSPEPILVNHWVPDPEPGASWDEDEYMIIDIQK